MRGEAHGVSGNSYRWPERRNHSTTVWVSIPHKAGLGMIYTRTGRRFFEDEAIEVGY
jgi:hypothetical protein